MQRDTSGFAIPQAAESRSLGFCFTPLGDVQAAPAQGSRSQAPGPDRCKYSLTAHRAAVPACPHLAHKQPGGHTEGQGTGRAELGWERGGKGGRLRRGGEGWGQRAAALGSDFMLVRAVHVPARNITKTTTVAPRLPCP